MIAQKNRNMLECQQQGGAVSAGMVCICNHAAVRRQRGCAPSNVVSHPRRLEVQQHGCEHLRMPSYHWSRRASIEPSY